MPHIVTFPRLRSPLLAAGLLLAPATLPGQSAVSAEPTVWLTWAGEHAVGARTSAVLDVHVRRADAFADWRQLMLRAGASRALGARVRVAAGWGYLRTYADAGAGAMVAEWDHRAWQMVQLSHRLGPVSVVHRGRLEQRFFTGEQAPADDRWQSGWRGRYQVRAALPLPAPLDLGQQAYVAASQELFAPFGPHERDQLVLDQTRTNVALGARLSPTLRMELGYLNRAMVDDGRARTRDHALQLAFASSAPLRARRAAGR